MLLSEHKMLVCLKQKDWSKSGVPATSTRCSDHLSKQFLITAFSFPYSSKYSSAEHIHTLPTCLTFINTLTYIYKQTHSHTDSFTHSHTDSFTHSRSLSLMHTETCIKSINMFGWEIFGAVWKGRGGGQELSTEVTRVLGWGSWNSPFRSVFLIYTH